jgi:hypothetical protein
MGETDSQDTSATKRTSLISQRAMSLASRPAFLRALGMALSAGATGKSIGSSAPSAKAVGIDIEYGSAGANGNGERDAH